MWFSEYSSIIVYMTKTHMLTCRTRRTGSGKPAPPFQQGLELSTGKGLQSSRPGSTTYRAWHTRAQHRRTQAKHYIYMTIKWQNWRQSQFLCVCVFTAHELDGPLAAVTDYLGDIVDALLESVHDHFFQNSHGLLVGWYGRRQQGLLWP